MGLSFKKIDTQRRVIKMPVSKFAKKIGVSRKTYYSWKNSLPILAKYAKEIEGVLCVDINDISEEDVAKLPKEMVRGLSTDVNKIKGRVKQAIDYIILENGLSNLKLAILLGLSESTIDNYRRGVNMPKFEVLQYFQNNYKISIDWIMDGYGEPFPGAHAKYPNVFGPEPLPPPAHYIKEGEAAYPRSTPGASAQQFSIDEDLMIAASVLASKTHYASALHLNIRSFSSAIAAESFISKCHDDLRTQGELIYKMQLRQDELDKHNNLLREEIKELKRTGGDSPPTALGMDHAALTGTADQEA